MPQFNGTHTYQDGIQSDETQLDALKSSIETFVNTTKLDEENIQNLGVATANINNLAVTTAKIPDGSVERSRLEALGHQLSSSSSEAVTSSDPTYTDYTDLTVTITTTGRPVVIQTVSGGASTGGAFQLELNPGDSLAGFLRLRRDSTDIAYHHLEITDIGASRVVVQVPASIIFHLDTPAAGTYTYTLAAALSPSGGLTTVDVKLLAYEV